MSATHRKLTIVVLIVALLFLALPMLARGRAVGTPSVQPPKLDSPEGRWVFESNQLEFYLGDDGIAYIRPGVKVKINSVTIPADRRPVIDVNFTDDFNQPLDRLGQITPGVISASWVLAKYDPATREYTSFTTRTVTTPANSPRPGVTAVQAAADSNGNWTDFELGHSQYRFRTALPADVDVTQTLTLGAYSTRNLTDILGKNYYTNPLHDFRLDSQAVTDTWNVISTASCNNCHDPISAHGGSRRELKLCVMCHSPQTVDPDTGQSQDMETLIHKVHMGSHLPSVEAGEPYIIIGNQQSVHDFSHVHYPQDLRNCDNCHEGITAAQKTAQSHVWYSSPTKEACFACHDNIDIVTGEGHPGGPRNDNAECATCHVPDSGEEWDASIKGAHTIPTKSKQLAGVNVSVVSIANGEPGKTPTVAFKITDDAGNPVDGSKLNTFAPILAGPTKSYTKYYRESAAARAVFDGVTGNTLFTFTNMIPADAKGTWTISGDFYKTYTLNRATPDANGVTTIANVRDSAFNPIHYFSVDGSDVEPRRLVGTTELCNTCHDQLALHGGQRQNLQECVICHNPTMTDQAQRPVEAGTPEAISMQYMIHRIHKGHLLENDLTIYGNGRQPHNYNEVGYPGDLRNCESCHTADSQQLPAKGDAVVTPRDYFTPMGSGTSACLGCHDSRDAAAHAYLNTTTFFGQPAEACGTCHGANSTWSVDKSHAR
jgi:OmcA/MtrC family decaheme c-type cytochrome